MLSRNSSYKDILVKGQEDMYDNYYGSDYQPDIPSMIQYTLSNENNHLLIKAMIKEVGGLEDMINHIGDECSDEAYENVKGKLGNKFVLLNFGPRPFGFFWGGNKESLRKVYEHYFEIFFESLPTKLLTEELIFKEINERYPELMHVIQVEHPSRYKLTCQDFLIK